MNKRYRAFISYSQIDKKWAKKLQRSLENFRIPAGVLAEINADDHKFGRVFRDDDDMSASESLGAALEGALDDSETLIVICSPNSAKSSWVNMEVSRFKRNPDARFFAVIVDGEPNAENRDLECFCPALRYRIDANGAITDTPEEPLAPDWRKDGLHKLTARLVAGVLGVNFDELWNREKRRRRKQHIIIATSIVLGLGLLATMGLSIVRDRNQEFATQLVELSQRAIQDAMSDELEADRHSNFERAVRFATLAAKQSILHPDQPKARALQEFAAQRALVRMALPAHRGGITTAKFSTDNSAIMSAGQDGMLRRWSLTTGELMSEHDSQGQVLAIDDQGIGAVVVNAQTKELYLWDSVTQSKQLLATEAGILPAFASFSNDGQTVISGGGTGEPTRIWSSISGEQIAEIAHPSEQTAVTAQLDAQGQTAAVALDSNLLLLWSVTAGKPIAELAGRIWRDHSLRFSPDGSKLVAGRRDDYYVYQASDGEYLGLLPGAATFSADGTKLAVIVDEETVEIRDAESVELLTTLKGHKGKINGVAFNPSAKQVLSASDDGTARLWEVAGGNELARFEGHQGPIHAAAFNDAADLVLTVGEDSWLRIFAARDNSNAVQSVARLNGHDGTVSPVRFSANGKLVLSAGQDKIVRLWNAKTGTQMSAVAGDKKYGVQDLRYDETEEQLILTAYDDSILIVNRTTGDQIKKFEVSQQTVDARKVFNIIHNEAAQPLVTPDMGKAKVWDRQSGELISTLEPDGEQFYAIKISDDGRRAVSLSWEGVTRIWDLNSGTEVARLEGHSGLIESAALSRDGRYIATAGQDNTASVWDAGSGREITTLGGFSAAILQVVFSNDSSRLAVSSADGSVRIFATSDFQELDRLVAHSDGVNIVQFDDSGQTLLTAGWDNTVRIWDLKSAVELAKVKAASSGIFAAALNPAGTQFVVADGAGEVALWQLKAKPKDHSAGSDSLCNPPRPPLIGRLRYITREDVLSAPVLEGLEGIDVCEGV